MKLRKLLALTMALTLAAAPVAVHAEPVTVPGAGSELETEAGVNYANTTVYKVTLPTSDALKFALDPQGLSTLTSGAVTAGSEGKIVSSSPWTVKNESSVDITVTGSFYLVDTDDTAVTAIADKTKIDNTKKQICMLIQERSGSAGAYTYDDLGAVTSLDSSAPSTASVNMTKAVYEFAGDADSGFTYEIDTDTTNNYDEKELVVGGVCASEYDWSAYTAASDAKTLTLKATFSFAKKAADTYVMAKGGDGSVSYTFVESAPTGTITALTIDGTARPGVVTTAGKLTYASNTVTISADIVSALLSATGNHTIDVTFTDGDTVVTKNLTYTVAE